MSALAPPTLEEVRAARERIRGLAMRTPLVRLNADAPVEAWLKLENLQPIGSFKLRGAGNALAQESAEDLALGAWTGSAGNMAQGVGWVARERGIPFSVVVPDHAPQSKLDAIARLDGRVVKAPFEEWWRVLETGEHAGMEGCFVHPVCDTRVMAGNGTIGLEILDDLPDVDAIVVPFGGGGLSCGIAAAVKTVRPDVRVIAAEPETGAPVTAAFAAGGPTAIDYTPSFVDGSGAKRVLPEMWPLVRELIDDAVSVSLADVAAAVRLLVERQQVVAEGAGALAVAAALGGRAGDGRVACIVSGGNIDPVPLAEILRGRVP